MKASHNSHKKMKKKIFNNKKKKVKETIVIVQSIANVQKHHCGAVEAVAATHWLSLKHGVNKQLCSASSWSARVTIL